MDNLAVKFGNRLRTLRNGKKMSQEELSFKASISAAHLGQIERAEKKPTLETIGRLADALEISLPELFVFEAVDVSDRFDSENMVISKINAQLAGLTADEQKDILRIIKIFRRNMTKNHPKQPDKTSVGNFLRYKG